MSVLAQQVEMLAATVHRAASYRSVNGAGSVITVPDVKLDRSKWNKSSTTVQFHVAPAYPFAAPDCFWADNDLRLLGGGMPQAAQPGNPIPGGGQGLWFSWHLTQPWNPNRDNLITWLAVIKQRLVQGV